LSFVRACAQAEAVMRQTINAVSKEVFMVRER